MKPFLTTSEAAKLLGAPEWQVRRIADELDQNLPRAGLYRLIPHSMIDGIRNRLPSREQEAQQ